MTMAKAAARCEEGGSAVVAETVMVSDEEPGRWAEFDRQKVFNHRVTHFFDLQAMGGDLLAAVGDDGVSVLHQLQPLGRIRQHNTLRTSQESAWASPLECARKYIMIY